MARELTDSERDAKHEAYSNLLSTTDINELRKWQVFDAGFIVGLDYQKAISALELADSIIKWENRVSKLLDYIRGEIPMSEIENLLDA